MKRQLILIAIALITITAALPALAALQATGVTAEAVGQANVRAFPDVTAELRGEIVAGTRYPVIGRHEFVPWLLIAYPDTGQPFGWVFNELLNVQGDVSQVPLSTLEVSANMTLPTPTAAAPEQAAPPGSSASPNAQASPTPAAPPAATPTLSAPVTGTVLGEINIRYGPGVEYPRVGIGLQGEQFEIVGRHTQLPWVEINYPQAPNGKAWVALELLEIQGNLDSVPIITRTQFNLPTLTPTLSVVRPSALVGATPIPVNPPFQALGDQLHQLMLDAGFEQGTSRLGALFLLDLQTGEALTFGDDIAFSGMSLNKIAILTTLYGTMYSPADLDEANRIAEAMICSENISTNEMLSEIGAGNPFTGAQDVTEFLQTLGMEHTFITAPYANDPFITPQPVGAPQTTADQRSAEPDPFNQATVRELGSLLGSIYQCAMNNSGPLIDLFPGQYTQVECRQMLHAMNNNRINALFESGIPPGTSISHKHGWIDDTHGDASIIYTPGGDYVLVAVVHNPQWLDYSESFPLLAEISRTVYNYYNPDAPVTELGPNEGAEQCELFGNPLIEDLMSASFDGI